MDIGLDGGGAAAVAVHCDAMMVVARWQTITVENMSTIEYN